MNKIILTALLTGLIFLSGFKKASMEYEQITFDYFIANYLENDFENITVMEFKGKTESTYSTLGNYKFCLKPMEKLQSQIQEVTKGFKVNPKTIHYEHVKTIQLSDFKDGDNNPKVYLYPAVRVADHFYVFLSVQKPAYPAANYVFELDVNGDLLRSCKMN